jgi:hypothetical protein
VKRTVVFLGSVLVFLNTSIGLLWSDDYELFNMLFVDVSLLLSMLALWTMLRVPMADGFRIGFSTVMLGTGLARVGCALFASAQVKENFALLFFLALLAVEGTCLYVGSVMSKK